MSRPPTFYLPPDRWPAPGRPECGHEDPESLEVQMDGEEAHHLLAVLRLKAGAMVRLFDGAGRWGLFRLVRSTRREAWLTPEELHQAPRPEAPLTLALGWNKSLRRGWLLEKASELEAGGLLFWQAGRSQGEMPESSKDTWSASLVAGAKQSENPWLPELQVVNGGAAGVAALAGRYERAYLLWESVSGRVLGPDDLGFGPTLVVVGPEGGLAEAEAQVFERAGVEPVSLGRRVLRWETAALVCLGLAWWRRQTRGHP